MNRLALAALLLGALVPACSSDSAEAGTASDAGKDVSVVADTAGQKNDGIPPADVSADAPPGSLEEALGRDRAGTTGLPIDLSCLGAAMPVNTGATTQRTILTADLGDSTALVPETTVEIVYSNKIDGAPDVTGTTAMTTADLKAKLPAGFFLVRTKKTGFLDTVAYDWWVDEPTATFAITDGGKLAALQVLAGGSDYVHKAGTSRLVVRVKDCKQQDVSNAHVILEVDGKVVAPVTKGEGVRRNYFGDNELPGKGTVTGRSGVVAFLGVPSATAVRLIAYAKTGGSVVPIAIRTVTPVADGVVTAYITPWLEP